MGYFNNGIGAARINDSSPSDYTTYSGNKIETKQNSTDNTLTTTSKNIVGAINEINSKVNNKFIIAQTLPVSDIDEFAIYLVPKSMAQTNNVYDEYIYISTDTPAHWEKIGDTEIDLSGYYTSSQVDGLLSDKQDATDNSLSTTDKTIVGAINENKSVIGYSYDEYDATTAYSKDDLCIYNNTLYKAKQATTGNLPTNTTYWEQTSIADEIGRIDTALSGITLDSNPASGDYHFELGAGWSVTNFVFNRVGNRIYMQGVFVKSSAFTSYETFITLSSSSTKVISPYYETWFPVMVDNGSGGNGSCERLQAIYGSLRIASSNTAARRIFVTASWVSVSDVI